MKSVVASALLPLLTLAGCNYIANSNCTDAKRPRPSTPLAGSHTFELTYKDHPTIRTEILCERYYDAQCSARGNRWDTREIGSTLHRRIPNTITIQDPEIGVVKFFRPSCELFYKPAPTEFESMIIVNGKYYFYSSQNEDGYVFIRRDFGLQPDEEAPAAKPLILPLVIKVDGKLLSPPLPPQS